MNNSICITEEVWQNSQLSVARFTGTITIGNHSFVIVNKEGKDIFQCSIEAERTGREKAIEPGEPADLCRRDFVKFYRKLKRERFLEVLREHPQASDKELLDIFKQLTSVKQKK